MDGPTNGPMDGPTWVGARDTCVSKNVCHLDFFVFSAPAFKKPAWIGWMVWFGGLRVRLVVRLQSASAELARSMASCCCCTGSDAPPFLSLAAAAASNIWASHSVSTRPTKYICFPRCGMWCLTITVICLAKIWVKIMRERKYLIALVPYKYLSICLSLFYSFALVLDPGFYQFVIYSGKMMIQSFLIKFFKHLTLLENFLLCIAAYNFEVSNIGRRSIWE